MLKIFACEQAVGKVVIKFAQVFELSILPTSRFYIVVNFVFIVRRLLALSNQALVVCAHTIEAFSQVFLLSFYTLSTGPNTTNKLNKGLSR